MDPLTVPVTSRKVGRRGWSSNVIPHLNYILIPNLILQNPSGSARVRVARREPSCAKPDRRMRGIADRF